MPIGNQPEIAQFLDSKPAKKRPEKEDGPQQERATEKRLEIKLREAGKNAVRPEPLRGPEKNWGGQGREKNRGGKIAEQSGCVLQEANVRFPPDAESTHMEGEGR